MSVNMSLDDIIAQNKKSKGGRSVGGFRSEGRDTVRKPKVSAGTERGFHTSRVPEGRWKHDLYATTGETEAPRGFRGERSGPKPGGNPRVRVLLSNLATTVNTADLEELFDPYNVEEVHVFYNEAGESVGTGDVSLRRKDALDMMRDLKGLAIDEKVVKMTLVDETATATVGTIRDRVRFNNGGSRSSGDLRRTIRGGVQKRAGGGRNFDGHDDRVPREPEERVSGGRKGGRGGRGGRVGDRKPKLTEDELNAQLDAYMSKGKDDDME